MQKCAEERTSNYTTSGLKMAHTTTPSQWNWVSAPDPAVGEGVHALPQSHMPRVRFPSVKINSWLRAWLSVQVGWRSTFQALFVVIILLFRAMHMWKPVTTTSPCRPEPIIPRSLHGHDNDASSAVYLLTYLRFDNFTGISSMLPISKQCTCQTAKTG